MAARFDNPRIAYFISPHGYGHASRAAGVMEALHRLDGRIAFEIFTRVPKWFFDDSLSGNFEYHSLLTDIGLVQKTPLRIDLPETLRRLDHFLPFDSSEIGDLAIRVKKLGCRLILCDIAPMGILVAKELELPSVLVENFTWDWLYQGYIKEDGNIRKHIDYLSGIFRSADFHIQTEPVCRHQAVDLTTAPVSRKVRTSASAARKKLGIPGNAKMVMVTMGGIRDNYAFLKGLNLAGEIYLVISGGSEKMKVEGNLVLLPHRSEFFHPDLVNASDGVIGKVGYSTLAEIYHGGVPFGYVARRNFRESRPLQSFIQSQMQGLSISEEEFHSGAWLSSLPDLLALPKIQRDCPNGADQAAHFICDLLNRNSL